MVVLQWGRNLPVAEMTLARMSTSPFKTRFNGAATFQSRKYEDFGLFYGLV